MRFVIFPSGCAHVHSHYQLVFGIWKRHASSWELCRHLLNGTDVLDHGMFAEALLTVVCTMKAGACLQERCFAVYVVRGKGAKMFSCFCCV